MCDIIVYHSILDYTISYCSMLQYATPVIPYIGGCQTGLEKRGSGKMPITPP